MTKGTISVGVVGGSVFAGSLLCELLLHSGDATLFFSDLTHQYVTFNAEYTT